MNLLATRSPHSSLDSPSANRCMTINTCSKQFNMQPHLPWIIIKRQPLPSYCSQTGSKTAPTLFTKTARQQGCLHYSWKYPKEEKNARHATPNQQSKTPRPRLEATWGIRILVVWNKAAREQHITNNPSWLGNIKQDLSPAAIWNFKTQAP
jgi:hypothetical protein